MGLLDQFDNALNSDGGQRALSLLAAAGPSATPQSFGQRLYGALQMDRERKADDEDRKARKQMQAMQMRALLAQAEARKQQQAQEQQRRNYLGAVDPSAGPAMPFSAAQAFANNVTPQEIAMLQPQQAKAPKLRSLEQLMGPEGKVVNVALFEDGSHKIMPYGVKPDIALQNLGDRIAAIDKNSLGGGQSFRMGASPDAVMSANTAMRGQNMTDARARESIATQQTNGRIPPGYRLRADGNLEAIPGGPADIKAGEAGAKAEQRRQMAEQGANSVLDTVGDAKKLVGMNTAGLGGTLSAFPATEARNLAAKLETIKANLGFDRLQQMREASPTGGALGAVAVQELTALQSTVSSLDQYQSPAQLRQSLDKIERHYRAWLKTVNGVQGGAKAPAKGARTLNDLLNEYGD